MSITLNELKFRSLKYSLFQSINNIKNMDLQNISQELIPKIKEELQSYKDNKESGCEYIIHLENIISTLKDSSNNNFIKLFQPYLYAEIINLLEENVSHEEYENWVSLLTAAS